MAQFVQKQQWENGAEYVLLNSNRSSLRTVKQRQQLMQLIHSFGLPDAIINDDVLPAISLDIEHTRQSNTDSPKWLSEKSTTRKIQPVTIVTYQLSHHITLAHHFVQGLVKNGIDAEVKIYEFPDFHQRKTLQHADIIISGEVFGEDVDLSWLDWFTTSLALDVSLSPKQRTQLNESLIMAAKQERLSERMYLYHSLEQELITQSVFLPLFHVKQHLSLTSKVSASEMLANGWIDFNSVVIDHGRS